MGSDIWSSTSSDEEKWVWQIQILAATLGIPCRTSERSTYSTMFDLFTTLVLLAASGLWFLLEQEAYGNG